MRFKFGKGCGKDRYRERHVNHETCAPANIDDLPHAADIYAGNDKARVADSIAIDLAAWLRTNQAALFSMTSAKAVEALLEQMAKILCDHGGQNGRRFRSGDTVMYLHLDNHRICTLKSPEEESWAYDTGVCKMGHPW